MKAGGGSSAVMAGRREPPDSLDFFPTPPFATRALLENVHLAWLKRALPEIAEDRALQKAALKSYLGTVWEPACGEGHMAAVLKDYASYVFASDVFDYGYGETLDFLSDFEPPKLEIDWIVTNPPFNVALAFALKALAFAKVGVALLCRSNWIEGEARYEKLFRPHPPALIAPFVERVAMVKGRWDPAASTATSYTWFVWHRTKHPVTPTVHWIPPGRKRALTLEGDVARFAAKSEAPLFSSPFAQAPDAAASAPDARAPVADAPVALKEGGDA